MRIVVPFTRPFYETAAALGTTGWEWDAVDVSGSDDAYWQLMWDLWAARETVCIVEHDIVVAPGTLDELAACNNQWCSAPYPYMTGSYAGMGCTKFDGALMARFPRIIDQVGALSDPNHPPRHWCRVDGYLMTLLVNQERHCVDHQAVGHFRSGDAVPWPAHGCVAIPVATE